MMKPFSSEFAHRIVRTSEATTEKCWLEGHQLNNTNQTRICESIHEVGAKMVLHTFRKYDP